VSYREYLPSPELAPFVDCYWSRDAVEGGESRVLPDGAVDFLFDLGAPDRDAAFVVGTMTRPLVVAVRSSYVAVRFWPGGVRAFIGAPVHELTDRRVPLACFQREAAAWRERIAAPSGPSARVRALDRLLVEALPAPRAPDPRVRAAVRWIERARGVVHVASLSRELGVSRQHLTRLFESEVGVGVKTFSRVVRMQSVVARLGRLSSTPNWAELALDAGFCDQSHLVNDFRVLTGLTPEPFFARSISPIPDGARSARVSA